MIAIVKGKLEKRNMFNPEKGKPHQVLFVVQETPTAIEVVKIKDFDLNRSHKVGGNVAYECSIRNWSFDGRDGLAVSLVRSLGQAAEGKQADRQADKKAAAL